MVQVIKKMTRYFSFGGLVRAIAFIFFGTLVAFAGTVLFLNWRGTDALQRILNRIRQKASCEERIWDGQNAKQKGNENLRDVIRSSLQVQGQVPLGIYSQDKNKLREPVDKTLAQECATFVQQNEDYYADIENVLTSDKHKVAVNELDLLAEKEDELALWFGVEDGIDNLRVLSVWHQARDQLDDAIEVCVKIVWLANCLETFQLDLMRAKAGKELIKTTEHILSRGAPSKGKLLSLSRLIEQERKSFVFRDHYRKQLCLLQRVLRNPSRYEQPVRFLAAHFGTSPPGAFWQLRHGMRKRHIAGVLAVALEIYDALSLPSHELAAKMTLLADDKNNSYEAGVARGILACLHYRTQLSVLQAAVASHIYRRENGNWPADWVSMKQVVGKDPFSGNVLRHRPIRSGFMVYSVGQNGRDERGAGDDIAFRLFQPVSGLGTGP